MPHKKRLFGLTLAVAGLHASPGHAAPSLPESFRAGVNSNGETCVATREWSAGDLRFRIGWEQPFVITCSSTTAADAQGYVSGPDALPAMVTCSAPVSLAISGIGPAEARRCLDPRLSEIAVDVRFTYRGKAYQGAALETSLGVLEAVLRTVAKDAPLPHYDNLIEPSISLAALPPPPPLPPTAPTAGIAEEVALGEGITALQSGRTLDASRLLNDALRLYANAKPATRIELQLAAGLADSNLSRFDIAEQHFSVAQTLLDSNPDLPNAAFAEKKLVNYLGLHLINQKLWADAIRTLSTVRSGEGLLKDPAMLGRLNHETMAQRDKLQSSLSDARVLASDVLEAQREATLSVAYLGLGQVPEAGSAIDRAAQIGRTAVDIYKPEVIAWLRAIVERQKGRVELRKGDYSAALAHFDCALAPFEGRVPAAAGSCSFVPKEPVSDPYQNVALLVEVLLERASAAANDPSRGAVEVLTAYRKAIDSLAATERTSYVANASMEPYFRLLLREPASAARDEEFFRAMQLTGEPAIAREFAKLQQVVSSDPQAATILRQRDEINRELLRLSTEIGTFQSVDSERLPELERRRVAARTALQEINGKLLATKGLGNLDDRPATIAELRAALLPGEAFLKLVSLDTTVFGIVVTPAGSQVYMAGEATRIDKLTNEVLDSARLADGYIQPFKVGTAHQLYKAIAGPAGGVLARATRIIYNPAGVLRQLPLSILISDQASVDAYRRQAAKADYSNVAFVARGSETAVALSPRAFLHGRNDVAPSNAPQKFLGLGENARSSATSAQQNLSMPFDCATSYGAWASALDSQEPISAREITLIGNTLGLANTPAIIRESFTDVNLLEGPASRQLGQYQVLHFATHGLPETQVEIEGCQVAVPPALVTTIATPSPGGAVVSDGLLSFDEVARLDLNANLVVLAACDTSAGATAQLALRRGGLETSSNALDGLVRSFITARARAVLATFWSIPASQQTEDLMVRFYGSGRTNSMSASLRQAQNELLSQAAYSHPFYWGAYFLVGDGAKAMFSAN